MKCLVKIHLLALTVLTMTAVVAQAATVTATPSTYPKGAYVNGGDGDQQFLGVINITLDEAVGAWINLDDITITLPADITVADPDNDGTYEDGIFLVTTAAVAITPTIVAGATASLITIDLATGGVAAAGDKLTVIFPVETAAVPAAGTADITVGFPAGVETNDQELVTITFADNLSLVTYVADYLGGDQSSERGDVYPNAAAAVTAALTDFVDDLDDLAVSTNNLGAGSDNWSGFFGIDAAFGGGDDLLDNDAVVANQEVEYTLWASQTASLTKIDQQDGHVPIDVITGVPVIAFTEGLTFAGTQLNGRALAEGTWYFYVTSQLTGDWVLGTSGSVDIRHYPVFYAGATELGDEVGIDYDGDLLFEPTGNDDWAGGAITLESGGVIARDGGLADETVDPTDYNTDNFNIYWAFEDVDDNARVMVFKSTLNNIVVGDIQTSGSDGSEAVTGLTGATKIHTGYFFEEDDTNWVNYDIYTDASTFETAGIWYFYIVTNDQTNQILQQVNTYDAGGAQEQIAVTVSHYPWLDFHQAYDDNADGVVDADMEKNFDTATEQYYIISWGETIDGDLDPDAAGTATIDLYYSTDAWALVFAGGIADAVDDDAYDYLEANATLITTITDDGDEQSDNRYLWDLRAEGIAAASYHIYGVITHGTDRLTVQLNTDGDYDPAVADDGTIILTHGSYMRPMAPFTGPPVELDDGDKFLLSWEGYDQSTIGTPAVFAVAVNEDAATPGNQDMSVWAAAPYNTADFCWLLPTSTNGAMPVGAEVGATGANGYVGIDMSDLTSTAGGAVRPAAGTYDVWYFFDADADNDQDWSTVVIPTAVKATGNIYITGINSASYDIEIRPNKASMAPGDILTFGIYASDEIPGGASNPDKAIFSVIIPNSSYFTLVDQVSTTAGTQPFTQDGDGTGSSVLNGTVLLNTSGTSGSNYVLGYFEDAAAGVDLDEVEITTFQLQMTGTPTEPIENIEITFGLDDPYVTNLYNVDGSAQGLSQPNTAVALQLGQPGMITGIVDVEGRVDNNQVVDFLLCPTGSLTPITTSTYLSANNDADGTDGVQITLDGGGYYTLSGVPTGEYDLFVHMDRYVDALRENVRVTSFDNVVLNFTGAYKLFGGDAAGYTNSSGSNVPDNRIDTDDTQAIATAGIGTVSGDPTWNTYADIDESGTVDVNDLFMAGKNLNTDGAGIFYKAVPATSDGALVWLAFFEESAEGLVYAVRAENLSSLSAYSAVLSLGSEYEVVSIVDGLSELRSAIHMDWDRGGEAISASAVIGNNPVVGESMDLMSITLRSKVADPGEPTISKATLIDGNGAILNPVISSAEAMMPTEFSLSQNFPNPFNPETTINFSLPVDGSVKLAVYNLLGQEVRTLVSGAMETGSYKAMWNSLDNFGQKVPSGLYFYRLVVDNKVINTHKMVLLK
ncbi:FlgD immunoglobulin-like domain containing protein [Candidatus Neomarinimicrobiota bacterium]